MTQQVGVKLLCM